MYNETKNKNENENYKSNLYKNDTDIKDQDLFTDTNINFHINENESYSINIFDKDELTLIVDKEESNNNREQYTITNIKEKKETNNELYENTINSSEKKDTNLTGVLDKNIKDIVRNIKREISLIDYKKYSPKIYNENSNKEESYVYTNNGNENLEYKENEIIDEENKEDNYRDIEQREIQIIENIELWTDNIEEQIENFAELCEKESIELNKKGDNNLYIGRSMQILLIILGSISVYSSSTTMLDSSIRDIIVLLSGFSTTVISSIYTMFAFTKKSTIIYEISLGLDNISRMIRCELLKPRNMRKSPYDLIYICNITRDKLIKKREYN